MNFDPRCIILFVPMYKQNITLTMLETTQETGDIANLKSGYWISDTERRISGYQIV